MKFDWDPEKSIRNLEKHGVSFEEAILAFDDPSALIEIDEKHSKSDETRESLIGESEEIVLVVIFTIRESGSTYRIISARIASKKERYRYEEAKRVQL